MTIVRIVSLFIAYISIIHSYPIILDNKSICTECFIVQIVCQTKELNISNFNESVYYCNRCNINNYQLIHLYCNLCEEITPCSMDTGCFNCNNCREIYRFIV